MNPEGAFIFAFACLCGALAVGMGLRHRLPKHLLSNETRDTLKLAVGFVATMSALILGLLLNSAKGTYDTTRNQVIQMSAKVAFLDRLLATYGPEAAESRTLFRDTVEKAIQRMWPEDRNKLAQITPNVAAGSALYGALQHLMPHDDVQQGLKTQAISLAMDLGQLQALLLAQSTSSISRPMLLALIYWLAIIFLVFSLLAPSNATTNVALFLSALSVSGAIFLIFAMDRPFGGFVGISSEPMRSALAQLANSH